MSNWQNNEWNSYGYCNYPAEVFPRPVRRAVLFVIFFNLAVVCGGAVLFSIVGGIRAVRQVITQPHSISTQTHHHLQRKDAHR